MRWRYLSLRLAIVILVSCLIPCRWLAHTLAPLLGAQETTLYWTLAILLPAAWGWYAEGVMDWLRVPTWRKAP